MASPVWDAFIIGSIVFLAVLLMVTLFVITHLATSDRAYNECMARLSRLPVHKAQYTVAVNTRRKKARSK